MRASAISGRVAIALRAHGSAATAAAVDSHARLRQARAVLTLDLWTWLGLVLSSAGLLWLHVALVMRTARMPALTPAQRLLSVVVPPLTPFYAYRVGVRRRSVLWGVLLVVYVGLRSLL